MKYTYIVLILFFFVTNTLSASPVISYNHSVEKIKIGNRAQFVIDSNHSFTIKKILDDTSKITVSTPMPNLGLSSNTYWATFTFVNQSSENLILKFNQPLLNEIIFYRIKGASISEIMYSEKNSFDSRKYNYPSYAFDMNANEGDTITYAIKFKSNEPIIFDVDVATKDVIYKEEINQELITGIYIGVIFVMVFYNLFIYLTILDVSYLAYVCYIVCIGLTHITVPGYGFKYLWPYYPAFNDFSVILFSALAAIAAIEFLKIFLKTKEHVPLLNKLFLVFEGMFIVTIGVYFTGNTLLAFTIVQLLTFILCVFMIIVAARVIYIGYRPAIFFLLAWLVLLVAACIFIGKDFGLLPYNFFTKHAMQIGSSLEVVLLSFALADRINILKKEKENSQAEALRALQENELIITNQNIVLERNVKQRTQQLQVTNNDLSSALSELKQAQSQLVNSEKMASLGQLTAGIAHEINNPINFVVSNVNPLKRDIEDIYELVNKYEMVYQNNEDEKISEINNYKKEIDYTYIKEEISLLIKGIEDGAVRTADIVKGLRVFSRLDETDLKKVNITDGINSTLTLLNSEITASMDLVKNFSDIPEIECFPGKLNQVFMNLLNNAIFAIKENAERKEKGTLTITTSYDESNVYVRFKDNGIGMKEEVKEKIFDPFFTTKAVGKGTGLGLSITFSIIKDHNGKIDLQSEYGKGTEFILSLPIKYKN